MEKIKIRNLNFSYPETEYKAIDDLSLDIMQGDFLVLCGPSGCGKTTLLKQLKPTMAPKGVLSGEILFDGKSLSEMSERQQAEKIGFVQQSPDNQIVTDKVWHELAFGLESLGYDTPVIRKRVAEMANFFGISNWFYKKVTELSGGQKQLLNLASVMVMQPEVLILDEPTSQLDPIAASDFLLTVSKINRELGVTVILTEHRLEESLPLANRIAVMEEGRLEFDGSPKEGERYLSSFDSPSFSSMPSSMRIWASVDGKGNCPVTVNEGREWFLEYSKTHEIKAAERKPEEQIVGDTILSAKGLKFRYGKDLPYVVDGLDMDIKKGEFVALMGSNGAGKSTTLDLLGGILSPCEGEVKVFGKLAMLPQNPQTVFVKNTVRSDLYEIFRGTKISKDYQDEAVKHIVSICRLEKLLDRHPYDLSGGEQQRAALAKVLLLGPDILLMDEPTKGLDAEFKENLAEIFKVLLNQGMTLLMVSHDIEFCAKYAGRCCLFFDGSIVSSAAPSEFFSDNCFYTTSASKISRGIAESAVTAEDVMRAAGGRLPKEHVLPDDIPSLPKPTERSADFKPAPLPLWRKIIAVVSLCCAVFVMWQALNVSDLSALVGAGGLTGMARGIIISYIGAAGALLVFALSVGRRSVPSLEIQTPLEKRKLSKRTLAATVLILLCIPLTLFIGSYYFTNRKYLFIALLIMLECMIPFFLIFEDRKPKARELVLIASVAAINVAGRSIFFMLPEFKPVFAITIVVGISLGGETGFMVGAMTMLVSNIVFGQGPWTPWQMFALGIIGFLSGILFKKGLLRRTRLSMAIFGAFSSIVIYGGIMNPASALLWAGSGTINLNSLLAYYITGFPMDCVRAVATCIFIWILGEPMLEKLDRIKTKYGLAD